MYNCEIFSLRKSKPDHARFDRDFDAIVLALNEHGIGVNFKTDVNADAVKLADALTESLKNEKTDQ